MNKNYNKYNQYPAVEISNRQWPNNLITTDLFNIWIEIRTRYIKFFYKSLLEKIDIWEIEISNGIKCLEGANMEKINLGTELYVDDSDSKFLSKKINNFRIGYTISRDSSYDCILIKTINFSQIELFSTLRYYNNSHNL